MEGGRHKDGSIENIVIVADSCRLGRATFLLGNHKQLGGQGPHHGVLGAGHGAIVIESGRWERR